MFCVRDDNGEEVSDSNCNDEEKPSNKQSCNSQPCPARLVYGSRYRTGWEERKLGGAVYLLHLENCVGSDGQGKRGAGGPRGRGNRDTGNLLTRGREKFGILPYF